MKRALGLVLAVAAAIAPARAIARGPELVLVPESLPPEIDLERVRAALEQDLGFPVRIAPSAGGRASVVVSSRQPGEVIVRFRAEDGRDNERSLVLPSAAPEAIESVALLAGNLVRDEASELAALLKKARPAAARAPAPPPAVAVSAEAPPELRPCTSGSSWIPAGADFVPFVGTSTAFGIRRTRAFALNVIGGVGEGIVGAELGSVFNVATRSVCGVQLGGVANVVAGPLVGAQIAGVFNLASQVEGLQIGVIDVARGPVRGAQIGAVEIADGVTGLQIGAVSLSVGRVEGGQIGAVNVAARGFRGLQLGATNFAGASSEGLQLGAINVAGDLSGVQLGLVNVAAGEVKGAQVGLVNVAKKSSLSIGLVTVLPGGRTHVDAWGMETGSAMVGVKHGGRYFHSIFGVGVRPDDVRTELLLGTGLGGRVPLPHGLHFDADALAYALIPGVSPEDTSLQVQARTLLGWAPVRGFALFGGPTFNLLFTEDGAHPTRSYLPSWVVQENKLGWTLRSLWPGATLGVQIL